MTCCSFCLGSNFRVLTAFLGLGKWQEMLRREKMTQQQQGLSTHKVLKRRTWNKVQVMLSNIKDSGKEQVLGT